MKEFDLELAKAGHPVCTRDGRPVRILCFDAKGDYPIVGLEYNTDLENNTDEEIPRNYTNEGFYYKTETSCNDLMMVSEIEESDDEEVRKAILWCIDTVEKELGCKDAEGLAVSKLKSWLEKQGEQDSLNTNKECLKGIKRVQKYQDLSDWEKKFDNIASMYAHNKNQEGYNNSWYVKERAAAMLYHAKKELEKQGEQKSVEKVEPKFKVGDWVVNKFGDVWHIDSFDKKNYQVSNGDKYNYFPISKQNEMHLWNIHDAKDGNVLCYKDEISLYRHDIKNCTKQEITFGGFVYYCCYDGKRFVVDSLYSLTEQDKMDIHPATKEQRDTLEEAMADAGYTFDFDKKELKKIQQKPAWSEEDEKILDSIIEDTMPYGECPDYPTDEEREYFYEGNRKVEWLKSLKDRFQ